MKHFVSYLLLSTNRLLSLLFCTLFIFLLAACSNDNIEQETVSKAEQSFSKLDAQTDLSSVNLEDFVLSNKDFDIVLNDTLTLDFRAIHYPLVENLKGDIVYNTEDKKGSVSFDVNNSMYFIYKSENYYFQGFLSNKSSEVEKDKKMMYERRYSTKKKKEKLSLLDTGKHSFVQYINLKEYYSEDNKELLTKEDKEELLSDIIKKDKADQARGFVNTSESPPIKLFVYTYGKALSNSDISWAKMHTLNSLKDAYGKGDEFHKKVITFFDDSMDGKKIVHFRMLDRNDISSYWKNYVINLIGRKPPSNMKYLLLTDFSIADGRKLGQARIEGSYAWAHVSAWGHICPAHEVGHMFGARHTDSFWDWRIGWFGWAAIDLMGIENWKWTYYVHQVHQWTFNKNHIRKHIDSF